VKNTIEGLDDSPGRRLRIEGLDDSPGRRLRVGGEASKQEKASQEEITVAKERHELKLGKGATFFVKSQLKRLPQDDETWEADFRAMPKPITQSATHYLGLVVVPPHGDLLAMFEIEQAPTVNDLATLIANAMRRPLTLGSHRPRRIHVRGNPLWKELFPHFKEIGIEVVVQNKLPQVDDAYNEFVRDMKKARSAEKIKPTPEQVAGDSWPSLT
jgi:hypothetical protein